MISMFSVQYLLLYLASKNIFLFCLKTVDLSKLYDFRKSLFFLLFGLESGAVALLYTKARLCHKRSLYHFLATEPLEMSL